MRKLTNILIVSLIVTVPFFLFLWIKGDFNDYSLHPERYYEITYNTDNTATIEVDTDNPVGFATVLNNALWKIQADGSTAIISTRKIEVRIIAKPAAKPNGGA